MGLADRVLGFLDVRPAGPGAHAAVARTLRALGLLVLASAAVGVLAAGAGLLLGAGAGAWRPGLAFVGFAALGLAVLALVCAWITFVARAWVQGRARAATHVLVLGLAFALLALLDLASGARELFRASRAGAALPVGVSMFLAGAQLALSLALLRGRDRALDEGLPAAPAA